MVLMSLFCVVQAAERAAAIASKINVKFNRAAPLVQKQVRGPWALLRDKPNLVWMEWRR
jgi:hypothetical protein